MPAQPGRMQVEFGVVDGIDDAAVLDHVMPVGKGAGKLKILFDEEDREPLRLQGA